MILKEKSTQKLTVGMVMLDFFSKSDQETEDVKARITCGGFDLHTADYEILGFTNPERAILPESWKAEIIREPHIISLQTEPFIEEVIEEQRILEQMIIKNNADISRVEQAISRLEGGIE